MAVRGRTSQKPVPIVVIGDFTQNPVPRSFTSLPSTWPTSILTRGKDIASNDSTAAITNDCPKHFFEQGSSLEFLIIVQVRRYAISFAGSGAFNVGILVRASAGGWRYRKSALFPLLFCALGEIYCQPGASWISSSRYLPTRPFQSLAKAAFPAMVIAFPMDERHE